jgi:3'-phosphoadenosine 5'-phosphosulfate sulfotransferase (PAPS reductase)/FAD synthetase
VHPVAKIDVMRSMICNSPRFLGKRLLVITGERAQESTARARYLTFEPHRTDTRGGARRPRHVDHWRPVHGWDESKVWRSIRRYGIVPHAAYQIGFGRVSCMHCVFASPDQLATIRWIAPERFALIAAYERQFGCTIKRDADVHALADRGRPYQAAIDRPDLVRLALSEHWTAELAQGQKIGLCPPAPTARPPARSNGLAFSPIEFALSTKGSYKQGARPCPPTTHIFPVFYRSPPL